MNEQKTEKIKLLLLEDDEDFSYALTSRLNKRNFEITLAFSAEEALDKFKDIKPDAVVADIKLPGMDGIDFLSKVRKHDEHLPVILITGYASLESAKEAVKLNAADYLLKPLESIDELLDPIYKAVHGYKLLRENKQLTDRLRAKLSELEQKNIALREILGQIEVEKKQMRDDVFANVDKLVLPALTKLKKKASSFEAKHLDVLHSNLEELTSPFGRRITDKTIKLTPREIEICNMIKNGLTSKEISQLLYISLQTIEKHRNNIRKKLDIVNEDINLITYLQTL